MREAARAMAQKAYRERYFCFSCLIYIFFFFKETSSKEVSWPGKVENVWYSHFAGFVLLFYRHLCNKSTHLLQIWAPQGTDMSLCSSPMESRKGWLMMWWTPVPHMPALFMPSQMQTDRHKLAFQCTVLTNLMMNRLKICLASFKFLFLFHSYC